jgi:hypothetical protein
MQFKDVVWTTLGWSLGAALAFGILYSALVRWVSKRGLEGQTAWSVVIGVSFTLLTMIPVFGIERVVLMFCFFAASGTPMVVEYLLRVQDEMQKDRKNAQKLAKDFLNDAESANRQKHLQ